MNTFIMTSGIILTGGVAVLCKLFKEGKKSDYKYPSKNITIWTKEKAQIDEIISVTGVVNEINKNTVLIDENIICHFSKELKVQKGETATIIGCVVGNKDVLCLYECQMIFDK